MMESLKLPLKRITLPATNNVSPTAESRCCRALRPSDRLPAWLHASRTAHGFSDNHTKSTGVERATAVRAGDADNTILARPYSANATNHRDPPQRVSGNALCDYLRRQSFFSHAGDNAQRQRLNAIARVMIAHFSSGKGDDRAVFVARRQP